MQIGTSTFNVRRYALSFTNPRGTSVLNLYANENGSLLRVSIPAQGLDVMREDLASSTARTLVYSNPGDEAVNIPAAGFNLGATLTRPTSEAARLPAVILLAGAGADDRDGVLAGVPMLGQLRAHSLKGLPGVRYDKRAMARAAAAPNPPRSAITRRCGRGCRWLGNRRDVDRDRIAVLGHSEGAWAALLAATRERRIAAVVTIASPSTSGSERVVEQQRHMLEQMNMPPADRVAKIELQTRINAAVMTGRGWEDIPADMRKQADTPWFQSLLTFDPARVIRDIRQPMLIVPSDLDAQVPVSHVDRLPSLPRAPARDRWRSSRSGASIPAAGRWTGDCERNNASLQDTHVQQEVTTKINEWLTKTFQAVR